MDRQGPPGGQAERAVIGLVWSARARLAFVALRFVSGGLFAFHGMQIVFGVLMPSRAPLGTQLWLGGVIELVTGVVIALGLGVLGRAAAFLASGTMAVAYVQFHWRFAGGAKFLPPMNQGELSFLYAFLFLFFAAADAPEPERQAEPR